MRKTWNRFVLWSIIVFAIFDLIIYRGVVLGGHALCAISDFFCYTTRGLEFEAHMFNVFYSYIISWIIAGAIIGSVLFGFRYAILKIKNKPVQK